MSNDAIVSSKSFKDWLSEGEQLYATTLREYQAIEAQLDELEAKLGTRRRKSIRSRR